MSTTDTHVVRTERANPSSTWTRWVCACGRKSKLFGYAGLAEAAGSKHAEAFGGYVWWQ